MKYIFCIVFITLFSASCYSQNDHLKPADFESLKEYYTGLFPLLYKNFEDRPEARYTLIPSFSSEFAFCVEQTGDQYLIISNSLSTSYWYAKDKGKVKLKHASASISKELYSSIVTLFKLLAKQTVAPKKKIMGLDGETSYFSTTLEGDVNTGETWSPDGNSPMGRVVKICKQLYLIGLGRSISQSETLGEINQIILDLQK